MKIIKLCCLILLIFLFSCSTQKGKLATVNTKLNKELYKSYESFVGELSAEEYEQIRELIEKELKTSIADDKSILINYHQFGLNCLGYGYDEKDAKSVMENSFRLSKKISKEHNAVDFFVYSESALLKERYENEEKYILDSGFFAKNVFTLQKNCDAFFILKPNGKFMKHYGTDYYEEVNNFLKTE